MKLYLIDTLSPFFMPLPENREYNWSKVPFSLLEDDEGLVPGYEVQICQSFSLYLRKVKQLGYNAITIDELCRMVSFDFYNESLKRKLKRYEAFYQKLFAMAETEGLKVYVTSDIMFFNRDIDNDIGNKRKHEKVQDLLQLAVEKLLENYSQVEGVIFRLGESDGLDVQGDFLSRLFIKTPKQCRTLIRNLIPLFEEREKNLIIRSWTIGAYSIGDLMWNKDTLDKVFKNIESDALIISHKFGESDFFKYLNLNPLFFDESHQKIVELQARREYEGFGEFPCFVGRDYEKIGRYLQSAHNMMGIMVWGQTGGWSHFNKLTYLRNSSLWVEINIYTIIKIFKNKMSSEKAIFDFSEEHFPGKKREVLLKISKISEGIVRDLWYIPEFSSKRLYFRRNRIPTILWIVWDNILISHMIRRVIRAFVLEKKEAVIDGYRALDKIGKLKKYGAQLGMDERQFEYMYDTYNIIAHGREYYLGHWNPEIQEKIQRLSREYREKYPWGFHISCEFSPVQPRKWVIKSLFRIAIRNRPQYTLQDKMILIRFSSLIYFFAKIGQRKKMPDFLEDRAMGIQTFLK